MSQYNAEIASLADITFAVLNEKTGKPLKTGFFITLDGWALTCAHGTRRVGQQITLQSIDAQNTLTAVVRQVSLPHDVALLEAVNVQVRSRLPLSNEWYPDELVLSLGYQWHGQVMNPMPLRLKTASDLKLWSVALKDEIRECMGLEPRRPSGANIQPGTSGAAVMRERDKQVIGVVIAAPGEVEAQNYDGKLHVPHNSLHYSWAMPLDQVTFADFPAFDVLRNHPTIETMADAIRFLEEEPDSESFADGGTGTIPETEDEGQDEWDDEEEQEDSWLRPIDDWTDEHREQVLEEFRERRPNLPRELVRALWSYWRTVLPGQPICPGDPETELALLLYARGYGFDVPEPLANPANEQTASSPGNHDEYCGQFFDRHRHFFEVPVTPPELTWGPRGVLAKEVRAALDSPVLDAWVLRRHDSLGTAIEQVLIVGQGVPILRSWVFNEMFQSSLRIQTRTEPTEDIFASGIMRILAPSAVRPLKLPYPVLGTAGTQLDLSATEDVQGELNRLVGRLEIIARQTGLVRVQERDLNNEDLGRGLVSLAQASTDEVVRIYSSPGETQRIVDVVDYARIPENSEFLVFSGDLLQTQSFTRLVREFAYSQLKHVLLDLIARWDLYQQRELECLRDMKEWESDWQEALRLDQDPTTYCVSKRSPTVTLESRFNSEVGKLIRIPPFELPTERYYEENVPILIESYAIWRADMEEHTADYVKVAGIPITPPPQDERTAKIRATRHRRRGNPSPKVGHDAEQAERQFQEAQDHADQIRSWFTEVHDKIKRANIKEWHMGTAFMRSIISQLIDAAMRNRKNDTLPEVQAAFDAWKQEIQPLFWFEWRTRIQSLLGEERDPRTFFSRQTFFQTLVNPNEQGEIDYWLMLPKVVVDSQSSAVAFDRHQKIMEVHDPTDYAQQIEVEEKTNQKITKKSLHRLMTSSVEQCTQSMLTALRKSPADVSAAFLHYFIGEIDTSGASNRRLNDRHEEAIQGSDACWGIDTAVRAFSLGAYHSSRRCLTTLIDQAMASRQNKQLARLYLFQAVIEAFAYGLTEDDIQREMPQILEGHIQFRQIKEVEQALVKARRADNKYVKIRMETLTKWGVHALVRQIRRDISSHSNPVDEEAQAALMASQAAEGLLTSLELLQVSRTLKDTGESGPNVLLKTGTILEKGLLPKFSDRAIDILIDLHDILTGREAPRLGNGE